jgi:hypothetical protein
MTTKYTKHTKKEQYDQLSRKMIYLIFYCHNFRVFSVFRG